MGGEYIRFEVFFGKLKGILKSLRSSVFYFEIGFLFAHTLNYGG